MATPQGFLLPVMGILLVTQEWTQRTGMVTFTLEPHRGKVIAAKVDRRAWYSVCWPWCWPAWSRRSPRPVERRARAWENIGVDDFGEVHPAPGHRGSPGPRLRVDLPQQRRGDRDLLRAADRVLHRAASTVGLALSDIAPWIDLGTSQQPLFERVEPHRARSGRRCSPARTIWVVLPFLAGLVRVLRAELK